MAAAQSLAQRVPKRWALCHEAKELLCLLLAAQLCSLWPPFLVSTLFSSLLRSPHPSPLSRSPFPTLSSLSTPYSFIPLHCPIPPSPLTSSISALGTSSSLSKHPPLLHRVAGKGQSPDEPFCIRKVKGAHIGSNKKVLSSWLLALPL